MKKLLVIILSILCLALTACGGPSAKDTAKMLNDKYYGDKGAITLVVDKFSKVSVQPKNVTKDILESQQKYIEEFAGISDKIKGEKVPKELEEYKNALLNYNQTIKELAELDNKMCTMAFNGKDFSSQAERDAELTKGKALVKQLGIARYNCMNSYAKITTGKELKLLTVNEKNYVAYSASNVDMAIFKREKKKVIGKNKYLQKKPVGKFWIVSIAVKNNQKDAITVDSSSFKLVDKEGHEFSTSVEGNTALQMQQGHSKGFLTKLNPTMQTEFQFVFDVPADATTNDYKLKASGGFAGSKVTIPLEVIEVPK